jgi:Cytochrome c7 and related cytochrome c
MSSSGRMWKLIAVALTAGGVSAGVLLLAAGLHAQTPMPTATPAPPPGMIPTTEVPFYAEWAGSPHANHAAEEFNHWNKEGNIPVECARCHSTPGFLDYLGADGSTPFKVDHPAPVGTVITCIACHNDKTLALTQVTFPSGVTIHNLGPDARCMTCHQGVESTDSVNKALAGMADDQVEPKLDFINVHYTAAAAMMYGNQVKVGYEYSGKTYVGRLAHVAPYTSCTACHQTHTLAVKVNDCMACHRQVTDMATLHLIRIDTIDRDGTGNLNEGVAQQLDRLRGQLLAAIMDYAKTVVKKPVAYTPAIYPYFFYDKNGNGSVDKGEAIFPNRYKSWTPRMMKAAYNYQFVTKDPGAFAHNPNYATELLHDSLADLGAKVKVDMAKEVRP